jgi:SagB-type dehydrogenase family enzyme
MCLRPYWRTTIKAAGWLNRLYWVIIAASFLACQNPSPATAGETAVPQTAPVTVSATPADSGTIILPPPKLKGTVSVEEAIAARRSVRSFTEEAITLEQVSQLMWAAQGITEPSRGLRAAPSAGATYPLEVYILINQGDGIEPGAYHYIPQGHKLERIPPPEGIVLHPLPDAATIAFAADYSRTAQKYGGQAPLFVHLEMGHAAENVWLQAVALGLAAVVNGIFNEREMSAVLNLPPNQQLLYIIRIGQQRK